MIGGSSTRGFWTVRSFDSTAKLTRLYADAMLDNTAPKDCPACDGSGKMPGAMRAVIYRLEIGGDVPCWVCHGQGIISKDAEISLVWLAYRKSRKALS